MRRSQQTTRQRDEVVATIRKNLKTGRPVWAGRRAPSVPVERLDRDITTDVLVIGAGITGAIIADALAAAGCEVAVVDRRGLAKGSTLASTALVQYEIDTPLITLTRKIGKEKAVRAWRRSRLAVEALAGRLGDLDVRDVERRNSLYLAGNLLNKKELYREHQACRAAVLPGRFLDHKELHEQFGIVRAAAILGYGNLVIDPRKSALALLHDASATGARIFSPMSIDGVRPDRGGVTATAKNGSRVRCGHLVFATGYEVPHSIPRQHHKITSTWAIATVPQSKGKLWAGECCIWEASDPYLYIRTTAEGRVLCGGADEDISDAQKRDQYLDRKTKLLRRKLHRLLPRLDTMVDCAWTGTFGETTTGLPIIGPIPGMTRCWAALGYGGNGTTYAAIAADVIVGAIAGRPDVDADLYGFPGLEAAD
jgi:glycine/D-amino acid oxidase-like deaminating enzyme